jgi:tetratricopeptide (TPR) repeat protein
VLSAGLTSSADAQSVQYRSPAGVTFRSEAENEAVVQARNALADNPADVELLVALGVAQSGVRQYREAIATFTDGLRRAPRNPVLLRWRGHRYLSVREFDRATADLEEGIGIDPSIYGLWYHLGVTRFALGNFDGAAEAFARAQPIAPDGNELAGATDWLWMSLMRADRPAEAAAMLRARPDTLPSTNLYSRRLQLYRGLIGPDGVGDPADTADVSRATLHYGLGNWYLVRGDSTRARTEFERAVASGGWPAFGFIVAEQELRRLR